MNKKTVYEWFLVVEGSGEFPFDMLRYDSAFPAQQEDSAALTATGRRRILLTRRGVNATSASDKRWQSFGWRVICAAHDSGIALEAARRNWNEEGD